MEENVFVADGRDGGHDTGVRGVVHGVEHVQADLLMWRQRTDFDKARDRCLGEAVRVHIAAIRPDGDEAVRVLQTEVPGAGCPHAHATQYDAVAVDLVVTAHGLDGLEDIRLAGPAVAVLHAAQRMQFDEVRFRAGFVGIAFIEARHELQLAHADGLRAAMQHDIEPHGFCAVVVLRDDDAVGLCGSIDGRNEAAHDFAFLRGPRRLIGLQRCDAFRAASQGLLDRGDIFGGERGFVAQCPFAAFMKNHGIGQQVGMVWFELRHLRLQRFCRLVQGAGAHCLAQHELHRSAGVLVVGGMPAGLAMNAQNLALGLLELLREPQHAQRRYHRIPAARRDGNRHGKLFG